MSKIKKDIIKELSLMLMYLTSFEDGTNFEGHTIYRAWKGYDFEVLNELDEEDLIDQGKYRNKSLYLTEKGLIEAKQLLEKYGIPEKD